MLQLLDMGFSHFLSPSWGIRGRCGYLAEADPEVLHDSGHWGTCNCWDHGAKEGSNRFPLGGQERSMTCKAFAFYWIQGKDACLDVTCISSFTGMWVPSWAPEVALHNVVEKKKRKYASICEKNGYKFIAFAFSTFGEFDMEALDTLLRIKSIFIRHSNNAKSGAFIFQRASICIQKEVGAQLVSRLPFNFM
nr:hypothetical protein [Tanacetum cinerariifolium]